MIERDVILDLLPLYRAGLGSPATRALVEAWLAEHPELAPGESLPVAEDGRWRESLERARGIARRRRWLFAAAITLTALTFALKLHFAPGEMPSVTLLAFEAPGLFAFLAAGAGLAWLAYWRIARAT